MKQKDKKLKRGWPLSVLDTTALVFGVFFLSVLYIMSNSSDSVGSKDNPNLYLSWSEFTKPLNYSVAVVTEKNVDIDKVSKYEVKTNRNLLAVSGDGTVFNVDTRLDEFDAVSVGEEIYIKFKGPEFEFHKVFINEKSFEEYVELVHEVREEKKIDGELSIKEVMGKVE